MTTLQSTWAHVTERVTKARDHSWIWAIARTALGIAILVAVLAAGFAIRVLVYVPL